MIYQKITKYSNILHNPNVSLLINTIENTEKGYLSAEAFTVLGKAMVLRAGNRKERLLKTFLKKHPKLRDFSKREKYCRYCCKNRKVF